MAPEVIKKQHYTVKADIWSLGCLMVEMLTACHPYPTLTPMQAIFRIGGHVPPEIPEQLSREAEAFLLKTFTMYFSLFFTQLTFPSLKENAKNALILASFYDTRLLQAVAILVFCSCVNKHLAGPKKILLLFE